MSKSAVPQKTEEELAKSFQAIVREPLKELYGNDHHTCEWKAFFKEV